MTIATPHPVPDARLGLAIVCDGAPNSRKRALCLELGIHEKIVRYTYFPVEAGFSGYIEG